MLKWRKGNFNFNIRSFEMASTIFIKNIEHVDETTMDSRISFHDKSDTIWAKWQDIVKETKKSKTPNTVGVYKDLKGKKFNPYR